MINMKEYITTLYYIMKFSLSYLICFISFSQHDTDFFDFFL